jgi:SAM-dependent methyltransferase
VKPFADHFSRVTAGYAAHRPCYPGPLFDRLASAAPGRHLVWDCATGTGQAALGLAGRFERVVASDASTRQVKGGEAHPRIHYLATSAEGAALRSASAELVTVAQALHWLDLDAFYAEAARVLVPGGVLAAWTYGKHRVDGGAIDDELDHFYRDVVGPYWPPERRWVEAGYAGLPFPFAEFSIPAHEMAEHWTVDQMLGYIGTWSAVVRCRETTGIDPMPGLAERLLQLWPHGKRLTVRWMLSVRAGRS